MAYKLKERLGYLAVSALVLLVDRLSKLVVQSSFMPGDGRVVVPGFFDLVHVHNTGVAFGLLSGEDAGARVLLLSGFAIAASLAVLFYSFQSPARERILQIGLALILGGALGNLIDRLAYGYVVDFLYFHAGPYYWPAFNAADTAITLGVACLAVEVFRNEAHARA